MMKPVTSVGLFFAIVLLGHDGAAIAQAPTVRRPSATSTLQSHPTIASPWLFAQAKRDPLGLSPEDRKKYDELKNSADRNMNLAYIAIGVAALLVVVMLILVIRGKKKPKI